MSETFKIDWLTVDPYRRRPLSEVARAGVCTLRPEVGSSPYTFNQAILSESKHTQIYTHVA